MSDSLQPEPQSPFQVEKPKPVTYDSCMLEPMATQDAFTPEECQQILDQLSPDEWKTGAVNTGVHDATPNPKSKARKTKNQFLDHSPENDWLFQRLLALSLVANHKMYHFDVDFFDAVQIAKYDVGDFYDWHTDIGPGSMGNRKLSMTVQLSAEEDYEGGELVLDFSANNFIADKTIGSATIFPSMLKHKVSPITKGIRYSIVVWVSGTHRFK